MPDVKLDRGALEAFTLDLVPGARGHAALAAALTA
jgi:hypothetical protein